MIKILFVSRDLPEEGGSGTSVYRLSLLRYFNSVGCEIDYLLLHYRGEKSVELNQTKPFKKIFNIIQMENSNPVEYPVWSSTPSREEINYFQEQVKSTKPDLIIVDHPWMSGLFKHKAWNRNILTAVLTHDVQYKKIKDFGKYKVNPYKRNGKNEPPKWNEELEKELLSYADTILAIQTKDLNVFKKMLPKKKIIYLPMSKNTTDLLSEKQIEGRILFIGGSAQHNSYGIEWFLDAVWPQLIKENNSISLHICGEVKKSMDLEKYRHIKRVSILGKVANLKKEYEEAQICIVPLRVGSGLKIKLVEAMSFGKACVSTSVGVYGVEEVSHYGVDVADSKDLFAKHVINLISDEKRRRMSEFLNKQYVKTYFSPDFTYGAFLLDVISELKKQK